MTTHSNFPILKGNEVVGFADPNPNEYDSGGVLSTNVKMILGTDGNDVLIAKDSTHIVMGGDGDDLVLAISTQPPIQANNPVYSATDALGQGVDNGSLGHPQTYLLLGGNGNDDLGGAYVATGSTITSFGGSGADRFEFNLQLDGPNWQTGNLQIESDIHMKIMDFSLAEKDALNVDPRLLPDHQTGTYSGPYVEDSLTVAEIDQGAKFQVLGNNTKVTFDGGGDILVHNVQFHSFTELNQISQDQFGYDAFKIAGTVIAP
jgi:hypothetical protein